MTSRQSVQKTKVYFLITNFYLIRKFVGILKYLTSKRSPKYLSKNQFQLINDKCFSYEEHCKNRDLNRQSIFVTTTLAFPPLSVRIWTTIQDALGAMNGKLPVFDLNNTYISIWNLVVVVSMLFFFIYIPVLVCFGEEARDQFGFRICKFFGLSILFMDIFKCLNTSFYKQGSLITERREIILNYMRNYFIIDLMSLGPIVFIDIYENFIFSNEKESLFTFFTFFFFLKISHFQEIISKFEEMIFIDRMFRNTLSLIKLIFRILLISHVFACLWYMVGQIPYFSETWLIKYDLKDQTLMVQYLYSYYYVCITMNTVGYGDITPQNPIEVLFSTVFIYLACGMFAYSLNSIGIIVNDLTKRQNEFSKEMNLINSFMKEKNINFDLRMRVRKYLEYIFHEEKFENLEEQNQIINKLSETLKEELLIEANGIIIRDIKLLAFNFSEETLRKTVSIMKEMRFTPGDLIFSALEGHEKDLFIIRKGVIELFLENDNNSNDITIIKRLQSGDFFGERAFFANREKNFSARSLDFTTVYIINQDEFLSLLRKNPKDYERFCEIRDRISVHNDYSFLFRKCFSCLQNTHLIGVCPILHYSPANDIIIQKFLYTPAQERKEDFKRPNLKCLFNSLKDIKSIQKKSIDIQAEIYRKIDSEDEEEEEEDEGDESNMNLNTMGSKNDIIERIEPDAIKEVNKFPTEKEESSNYFPELLRDSNTQSRTNLRVPRAVTKRKTRSKTLIINENAKTIESLTNKEVKEEEKLLPQISMGGKTDKSDELFSNSFRMPSGKCLSPKLSVRASIMGVLNRMMEHVKGGRSTEGINVINGSSQMDIDLSTKTIDVVGCNKDALVEIDMIKSYEDYFTSGNIENVLEKIEQMKRAYKKIRKSKSIYSKMNIANKELMDGSFCLERSKVFENNNGVRKGRPNIMRKNFFKNSKNLEKMIKEELFNPEKLKDYYIKKYQGNKRKGMVQSVINWWRKMWKKKQNRKSTKIIRT